MMLLYKQQSIYCALKGLEIDNLIIEIDSPELPIFDEVQKCSPRINESGIIQQGAPRKVFKVKKLTVTKMMIQVVNIY